ncbi:MAG: cytochrome c [Myxococcales bacterium]|nr:cytochrome c [Myxococcales bacterium]
MVQRFLGVSLVFLALGGLAGCSDEGGDDGGSAGAGLAPKLSVIQTEIFDKSCAFSSCHGANATSPELTAGKARAALVDRASNIESGKQLVVPGKPDDSLLYLVLKGPVGSINQMPKGAKLDAAKIEAIRQWIAEGAQDN